jgi:transposase-like protein
VANTRKKYTPQDKVKIILEILKGESTMSQIISKYGAHGTQICNWKKQAVEGLVEVFSGKRVRQESSQNELVEELYKQIGQMKVELDWLKKKSDLFNK